MNLVSSNILVYTLHFRILSDIDFKTQPEIFAKCFFSIQNLEIVKDNNHPPFYPKQNRVKPFALAKGNAILHPMLFTLSSHRNSTRRPIIFPVEPLTRSPSLPVLVSPPLIPSSDVVSGISRNKRRVKSKIPRVSPRLGQASNELTDSRVSRFSAEWIRACLLRLADRNAVMEAAYGISERHHRNRDVGRDRLVSRSLKKRDQILIQISSNETAFQVIFARNERFFDRDLWIEKGTITLTLMLLQG